VHELGHYLAARWCGVRVETFSLGFGPRLLGFRRGDTDYQLALVPLGGFCRMAGEERRLEGLPPAPDELPAKSVGARFFIYSGGVLMNMLFGLVVFPVLFRVGVPFTRPIVGETVPGGVAWHARVPEGREILAVNDTQIFEFEHLFTEIALGDPQHATLRVRAADGGEELYELAPTADEREGFRTIGVLPDFERDEHGHPLLDVASGSAATRAGLAGGEALVAVVGGVPGLSPLDQIALAIRADAPLELAVLRDGQERRVRIEPEITAKKNPPRVGIAAQQNRVKALRSSPTLEALGLAVGDVLLDVNGREILGLGDLQLALVDDLSAVRMRVKRAGSTHLLTAGAHTHEQALALAEDIALGIEESSTRIVVQPGDPAERAGLRTHDEVIQIDGTDTTSWADVQARVRRAGEERRAAAFVVRREGALDLLRLEVVPEERPVADYGLALRQAEYIYRSETLGAALVFGARYSWRFLEDSWLTLKRMLTRDVSPKNVGGIITISTISYSLTESGWPKFFFFLCLVSINLAFLNVLPIPVLDGGHLFFLVIEKLKGSPVSNRVLGTSQAVGVVLILSLMVYVTYNDLVRWVLKP
jgi:regulator of sigma E protease